MKKLLVILLVFLPVPSFSQDICDECLVTCAIASDEVCQQCIENYCDRIDLRRVTPKGPPLHMGVYPILNREIGLTQIYYDESKNPFFPAPWGWTDNIGITDEIRQLGFTSCYLWMDSVPYRYGYYENEWTWVEHEYDPSWGEDMRYFWQYTRCTQVFVRFHTWLTPERGCNIDERAPYWFILNRLYDYIWWKDITVVFAPWEQDWVPRGCAPCGREANCCADDGKPCSVEEKRNLYMARLDKLIAKEEMRIGKFNLARQRAMKRYPNSNLRVLTSMTVNRFPGYNVEDWADGLPTVADRIATMENKPDLVGFTYHMYGKDPIPALDWLSDTTGYPPKYIFANEFGAKAGRGEVDRYREYISAFWDWGIRAVLIWVYKDPWEENQTWGITDEGMKELQRLNVEAITWH